MSEQTLQTNNMTQLSDAISTLNLKRNQFNKPDSANLQAWDAADEYLLKYLGEEDILTPDARLCIVNDSFGALTISLNQFNPVHFCDSYMSQQVTKSNLVRNQFKPEQITFLSSLDELIGHFDVVIIKVPKTLSLLEFQLHKLAGCINQNTVIIAAGKAKEIHLSTLALFEKNIGATHTSLAWKKARLIFCSPNLEKIGSTIQSSIDSLYKRWSLDSSTTITNLPNVFSMASLDIGARFFMEYIPTDYEGKIVDLGCGNGVIGLTALKKNPLAEIYFVDESYLAVESSRLNILHNYPEAISRCHFLVNDALCDILPNSVNLVLCNPPFHQSNTITDDIALRMFETAKLSLVKDGELRIIGNRHLNYYHELKKLFKNCKNIASNNKFSILSSIK